MASGSEAESSAASSGHEEGSKQRGPTVNTKTKRKKLHVPYNRHGVPVGNEGTKLVTFEGMVARTMVPITFESWRDVDAETKQELWEHVKVKYHFNNYF